MATSVVTPRLFRGVRDLLPEEMAGRQRIVDTVRRVYELYGFAPLQTPAIEYLDVLAGSQAGEEVQESVFKVSNPDKSFGEEKLGLRFDLTVPLARVVSQYRDLPMPFRRYQVASVWRADNPGPGRFREFTQFDIDSVGAPTGVADVEIIAAMCDTLSALAVGGYRVRFSSRSILNLLLKFAELPDTLEVATRVKTGPASWKEEKVRRSSSDIFRVLDKLERTGREKVRLELTSGYTDESGDVIPGLGLDEEQVARIESFLAIASDRRQELLDRLYMLFKDVQGAGEEIDVLANMSDQLAMLGYGDDRVVIDLSVARGLAYYTGPVFEAVLLDAPQFGAIFGGGRFDDLVMRFLGKKIPATGASMGVDRLLAALVHLDRVRKRKTPSLVLITAMDPSLTKEYLAMTFELRRAGIPCEMYLGGKKSIGRQLKYADEQGIPIAVIVGGDEQARNAVTLKDLVVGRQKSAAIEKREEWVQQRPGQVEVARAELVSAVRKMLATTEDDE